MKHVEYPTIEPLAGSEAVRSHGVVYTRPWVVNLILDLAGYAPDKNLIDSTIVEPSCGDGGFLEAMIQRLSSSCRLQGRPLRECEGSLLALDLSDGAVLASRARVEFVLSGCGWDREESRKMSRAWVRRADFLLDPELDLVALGGGVDYVVGNPPYVRLESVDRAVADTYRKRYGTMSGRADLYVGFYERALEMLAPGGVCAFICADRWMLNQYGSRLRKLVTSGGFSVEAVIEMHQADPFRDEVLAYPAVTTIRRDDQGKVLVASISKPSGSGVEGLIEAAREVRTGSDTHEVAGGERLAAQGTGYVIVDGWFEGSAPWPCVSPERLELLKHLESSFPPLEDPVTGTKVGIGVATGADRVFLTKDPNLVEASRLLPLAMAKDTTTGALDWSGHYLVNPWEADGSLVDLRLYPRLRRYFKENETAVRSRNVGRKNPLRWHRTIDKVDHALTPKPKLLIPDIKSFAHPVFDNGRYYPHHNLYYVTSQAWDLKVLGGILLSRIGQFFIECYAVRMNGGFFRFQAQYLRRIRVPQAGGLDPCLARDLAEAFERRDVDAATDAALLAYGIDGIPE